jgi:hypothetical protein
MQRSGVDLSLLSLAQHSSISIFFPPSAAHSWINSRNFRMAEIFAAVASGAGLVSLAIQLLESSEKLKELYNASRSAPKTVSDLCFELETLSLQLRQLERHRQHDRLDTEILDRCIAVCERRVARVRDVVDAMARYMRRGVAFGSVYTAFKEPEMRKLLDELEQAKSSLSLAYISYCQYESTVQILPGFS